MLEFETVNEILQIFLYLFQVSIFVIVVEGAKYKVAYNVGTGQPGEGEVQPALLGVTSPMLLT